MISTLYPDAIDAKYANAASSNSSTPLFLNRHNSRNNNKKLDIDTSSLVNAPVSRNNNNKLDIDT
eukprot:CAMPEP_0172484084 /NCGR_PEP_ID=MMETSP1066-20121228/11371_1 /TAXON_ID=671091 /ORGANISM="Coscinodiscus wailesii, Strain CCMP2513" /LENGTH=64 /DNA_ID=CAMNT_0013248353 /DNA_START=379 /DNA_END=569 /DNA_ORIENTATION=-